MFFKKKQRNYNKILWIDEIYGVNKKRLKNIKKKQRGNLFQFEKIGSESKLDVSAVDIVQFQELKELEIYFNSNILGTYLLMEEIKNDEDNRLFAYNTDLIFLNTQCLWDYILQYINTYFSLGLVKSTTENANIKEEQQELDNYLKENAGKLDEKFIKEAKEFILKKFKVVTKNSVVSLLKDKFEISGILEGLILILEHKNMDLAKYRNKIAHQKSTISKVEKSKDWFNCDEIAIFNNNGALNKNEVLAIINEEFDRLKFVLNSLYTIKINGLYPNLKENADKVYKVLNIKCKNCETKMHIPFPDTLKNDPKEAMDFLKLLIKCRSCSSQEFEVGEIELTTERGYFAVCIDYVTSFSK
ncbi:hypothetical protein [Lysinibacillus xylanilyticus]|uniref:hypothetical protein n=1 Tax=Lysinibacillus xylanilyticus TaxID=582475 RepID=UPI003D9836D0